MAAENLADELLGSIFDEIRNHEIVLEEEQVENAMASGPVTLQQRQELYQREAEHLKRKTQTLIRGGVNRGSSTFQSATYTEHVKPMFESIWCALMATLSVAFEEAGDSLGTSAQIKDKNGDFSWALELSNVCLEGFAGAVRISCLFHITTAREAFIMSLAGLTGLPNAAGMKPKNFAALRTLIDLANR